MSEDNTHKANHGSNGIKNKFKKREKKGWKGPHSKKEGKVRKSKELDFLDEDDGGHFGLLQHMAPSDLAKRKWVKVDVDDMLPEGFDISTFVCFIFYWLPPLLLMNIRVTSRASSN